MSESALFPDFPAPETTGSGTGAAFGSTQSLYRKYRPQSFDASDLVGQDSVIRTLRNAIRLDRVAHAYLFTGPRGTGKTTTARLLAKAVNCLEPDVDARPCNRCAACVAINKGATTDIIEIDAASNRGIDDIRELRERVKFVPTFLKTKFYIVDEAHQITGAAANAFLKTLEEPPPHTKFILATTDPEQLLPTIVSRCQRFDFKRISRDDIVDRLSLVARAEAIEVEPDALRAISDHAGGSLRDALGLLDQLASYRSQSAEDETRPISAGDVDGLLGIARSERVVQLLTALAEGDAGKGLSIINAAFEAGEDPRQLNRQLVSFLRAVMFQTAASAPGSDEEVNSLARQFSLDEIARHAARFSEIDYRIRHATLQQLPLEIAFVQATLDKSTRSEQRPAQSLVKEAAAPRQTAPVAADRPPQIETEQAPIRQETRPVVEKASTAEPAPKAAEPESSLERAIGSAITVDLLHDLWPKIRLDVKARDRRIEALLSSCDPARVNGAAITLVTSYKFHLEKMNEDGSRQMLESVIGRLVNQMVTVTTEIRGANISNGGSAGQSPSNNVASSPDLAPPAAPPRTDEERTVIDAARNIFDAEEITPRS